jgi:hypothetical protein
MLIKISCLVALQANQNWLVKNFGGMFSAQADDPPRNTDHDSRDVRQSGPIFFHLLSVFRCLWSWGRINSVLKPFIIVIGYDAYQNSIKSLHFYAVGV